jgi:heme/copper-type cytochrome/quinol oxidase subunit 2
VRVVFTIVRKAEVRRLETKLKVKKKIEIYSTVLPIVPLAQMATVTFNLEV